MKTKEQILMNDLRETLKKIIKKEIENLSETLQELEPNERINAIHKLMPYVFPKIQTVHSKDGEPFSFDL